MEQFNEEPIEEVEKGESCDNGVHMEDSHEVANTKELVGFVKNVEEPSISLLQELMQTPEMLDKLLEDSNQDNDNELEMQQNEKQLDCYSSQDLKLELREVEKLSELPEVAETSSSSSEVEKLSQLPDVSDTSSSSSATASLSRKQVIYWAYKLGMTSDELLTVPHEQLERAIDSPSCYRAQYVGKQKVTYFKKLHGARQNLRKLQIKYQQKYGEMQPIWDTLLCTNQNMERVYERIMSLHSQDSKESNIESSGLEHQLCIENPRISVTETCPTSATELEDAAAEALRTDEQLREQELQLTNLIDQICSVFSEQDRIAGGFTKLPQESEEAAKNSNQRASRQEGGLNGNYGNNSNYNNQAEACTNPCCPGYQSQSQTQAPARYMNQPQAQVPGDTNNQDACTNPCCPGYQSQSQTPARFMNQPQTQATGGYYSQPQTQMPGGYMQQTQPQMPAAYMQQTQPQMPADCMSSQPQSQMPSGYMQQQQQAESPDCYCEPEQEETCPESSATQEQTQATGTTTCTDDSTTKQPQPLYVQNFTDYVMEYNGDFIEEKAESVLVTQMDEEHGFVLACSRSCNTPRDGTVKALNGQMGQQQQQCQPQQQQQQQQCQPQQQQQFKAQPQQAECLAGVEEMLRNNQGDPQALTTQQQTNARMVLQQQQQQLQEQLAARQRARQQANAAACDISCGGNAYSPMQQQQQEIRTVPCPSYPPPCDDPQPAASGSTESAEQRELDKECNIYKEVARQQLRQLQQLQQKLHEMRAQQLVMQVKSTSPGCAPQSSPPAQRPSKGLPCGPPQRPSKAPQKPYRLTGYSPMPAGPAGYASKAPPQSAAVPGECAPTCGGRAKQSAGLPAYPPQRPQRQPSQMQQQPPQMQQRQQPYGGPPGAGFGPSPGSPFGGAAPGGGGACPASQGLPCPGFEMTRGTAGGQQPSPYMMPNQAQAPQYQQNCPPPPQQYAPMPPQQYAPMPPQYQQGPPQYGPAMSPGYQQQPVYQQPSGCQPSPALYPFEANFPSQSTSDYGRQQKQQLLQQQLQDQMSNFSKYAPPSIQTSRKASEISTAGEKRPSAAKKSKRKIEYCECDDKEKTKDATDATTETRQSLASARSVKTEEPAAVKAEPLDEAAGDDEAPAAEDAPAEAEAMEAEAAEDAENPEE